MSWKCDFCPQRIFTTKTSYTNHIKQCLKSVDSSEELSLEEQIKKGESLHREVNHSTESKDEDDEDEEAFINEEE
ncbi:hypothetical protein Glove_23g40 [Diversispora epigaea]|uniref:Uncharacterized protein n=1 Tax=Diversispora epigaea TaxID=1348612 RepID=A0A397JM06_9GLOM|nr:hypothetical protein Glove_23g40 [Diversispora epigaea]